MSNSRFKFLYYLFSFLLSIYLVFAIIVEYTPLFEGFKATNELVTKWILVFFVIDIIIQYFTHKNVKSFLKSEWISLSALVVSISVIQIFNFIAGSGFLVANKMYFFIKLAKKLKWVSKIGKSTKLLKSIKLGKKTVKTYKRSQDDEQAS